MQTINELLSEQRPAACVGTRGHAVRRRRDTRALTAPRAWLRNYYSLTGDCE